MIAILNFYCLAAKFDFSASQIIFQSRLCTEYLHSPPITEKCRILKGRIFLNTLYKNISKTSCRFTKVTRVNYFQHRNNLLNHYKNCTIIIKWTLHQYSIILQIQFSSYSQISLHIFNLVQHLDMHSFQYPVGNFLHYLTSCSCSCDQAGQFNIK